MEEYPKALYRGGEVRQVADVDQELGARDEGFKDWADDQAGANQADTVHDAYEEVPPVNAEPDPSLPPARNKPGRKPKAA